MEDSLLVFVIIRAAAVFAVLAFCLVPLEGAVLGWMKTKGWSELRTIYPFRRPQYPIRWFHPRILRFTTRPSSSSSSYEGGGKSMAQVSSDGVALYFRMPLPFLAKSKAICVPFSAIEQYQVETYGFGPFSINVVTFRVRDFDNPVILDEATLEKATEGVDISSKIDTDKRSGEAMEEG